jgi:hypothetical protein
MTVTADALDLLAGDPPRYPHVPGDFHRHPETGAPYVNHPTDTTKDGRPKRVMYGRPSSFGAALDNPFSLIKWKDREELVGAAILELDYEYILANRDDKKVLDGIAADCYEAAGSHLAADRGTHIHLLCEYHDRGEHIPLDVIRDGERLGIPKALQGQIVEQWRLFRARLGLTALAVEQTVVNDRWRLAGTLDRLDVSDYDHLTAFGVLEAGVPFVGDIKTGGLTVGNDGQPNYWVKYPVQLAAYVDSVPYDVETDERYPWNNAGDWDDWCDPNPDIALIYHYDLARALAGEVVDWQAIPVNVRAGREGGDLCRAAADFAKRRDLFAMPAPSKSVVCTGAYDCPAPEHIHGCFADSPCPHEPRQIAAPVGPNPAVEQRTADPEPSTASTAVPGRAAEVEAVRSGNSEASEGGLPHHRDQLIARIKDVIASWPSADPLLRRHWPEGVPTLKHDGHTDAQLQLILAAVRRVEAEVGAGWHPDDGPPPHVNTDPRAQVDYPTVVVDEGGRADLVSIQALHAAHGRLSFEQGALVAQIATEARQAGRNLSVSANPTVRRWSIARAVIAWAASGRTVDELWFHASMIATFGECKDSGATLGGLLSQFTISQADRLYEAAGQ